MAIIRFAFTAVAAVVIWGVLSFLLSTAGTIVGIPETNPVWTITRWILAAAGLYLIWRKTRSKSKPGEES